MSFYDLAKDGVALKPKELFQYRSKKDCSVPSRGGQKEFEPDGSWIQGKRLETFLQDRTSLLSEPRVEKLRNVAEGSWDSSKNLVNLKKPGKFWMHMGFCDERRNWLYPEEALYLMETNTLEVYHEGRPLSIQEAYSKFLGSTMCLEEYQVFSHLRRIGYVVLRHEEERVFTDYERQINLTDYISKKERKEIIKKGKGKSTKVKSSNKGLTKVNDAQNDSIADTNCSKDLASQNSLSITVRGEKHVNGSTENDIENRLSDSSKQGSKRQWEDDIEVSIKCPRLAGDTSNCDSSESETSFYNISPWSPCFQSQHSKDDVKENDKDVEREALKQTVMDSDSGYLFPDYADAGVSGLKLPPSNLLPLEMEVDGIEKRIQQKPLGQVDGQLIGVGNKKKEFSCYVDSNLEMNIKAKSWFEYKSKKAELLKGVSTAPMDYLWEDDVKPLMRPSEIESYKDVMSRLQIIPSADNEDLIPDVSLLPNTPKISFDVHLPDHCFKKTMPGIPDHRVCVTRCDGLPPGLTAIQYLWNKYKDKVPVHWAVVDSGEIAFYVFDNSSPIETVAP